MKKTHKSLIETEDNYDIFAPGVVQICHNFLVLVSFLHQGWCNIFTKVVQILTPNNNNIIKTTTTMLGYQNWTWVSPILIP